MRYALGLNNKALSFNNKTLGIDPYNPLNLPPYTVRFKLISSDAPTELEEKGTLTLVSQAEHIWDFTYQNHDWSYLFEGYQTRIVEILGINSTNVTNMSRLFENSYLLITVPLFDTSLVTDMSEMFVGAYSLTDIPKFNTTNVVNMSRAFKDCSELKSIPLLDTSNVINMERMLYQCSKLKLLPLFNTSKVDNMELAFAFDPNIESGALALYQQASTQANPPTNHDLTFDACGANTKTGLIELHQIPGSWGGLAI